MADSAGRDEHGATVSLRVAWAVGAGLIAAWTAAGSIGLLAEPLRIVLTWLALTVAWGLAPAAVTKRNWLLLAILVIVGGRLFWPVAGIHDVLLVSAVLAWLAAGQRASVERPAARAVGLDGPAASAVGSLGEWRVLSLCAWAVLVFAGFRWATLSSASVWLLSDAAGHGLGIVAGALTGKPLDVGCSFGGVDFLVLMAAFYAGWLWSTGGNVVRKAVFGLLGMVAAQLLYLIVLAHAWDLAAWLPERVPPEFHHPYEPPAWSWSTAVGQVLPWNLPLLAVAFHAVVAVLMARWSTWPASRRESVKPASWRNYTFRYAPLLLAAGCGMTLLTTGPSNLGGKRFVAFGQGRLDWERPQHDHYGQAAAGTFGILPWLVQSLGGSWTVSEDLKAEDLNGADVLVLLHPWGPWPQDRQQQVRQFLKQGGSVLLAAEPQIQQETTASCWGEILQDTGIAVREDVAISATGQWRHAVQLRPHPATWGWAPRRTDCVTDSGCSLEVAWPAAPLAVGRWGWSDPGSDAVLTERYRLESGERMGDLPLVAEQRMGRGVLLVLGDARCLTNEGLVQGYRYSGRILSYLARPAGAPAMLARTLLALVCLAGMLLLLTPSMEPQGVGWSAMILATAAALATGISRQSTRVIPTLPTVRTEDAPGMRGIAYLDAAHVEAYSDADWSFDGINGLALTLMRAGYLTLACPEVTSERLAHAAIFVSIAPSRKFTDSERAALRDFVQAGGVLISTVGAEQAAASRELLAEFGFEVPLSPVPTSGGWPEPEPSGRIAEPYLEVEHAEAGRYAAQVNFHAAWPVSTAGDDAETLAWGRGEQPIAKLRTFGNGRVVVVGDTGFAMNKNLEYIGGEPFDGRYDNAHFWRWLISVVTGGPEWIPPPPLTPEQMIPEDLPNELERPDSIPSLQRKEVQL